MGSSSLIDVLATHADQAGAPVVERCRARSLVEALRQVPDQRDPRGVVHALAGVLAVAVAAVLTGARSVAAIGDGPLTSRNRSWPIWRCSVIRSPAGTGRR